MKIKKLISLLLAAMLIVTSNGNCSAMISDSDSEPTGSPSNIVIPKRIPRNEHSVEEIKQITRDFEQFPEKLIVSDDIIAAVDAACDSYDAKLDRERDMKCTIIRGRDDARLQLRMAEEALKKYEEDIICTCFQRNPAGELIPLIGNPIIPRSCIFSSKRFYKGMLTGALIVAVVLIGMYVYVYYIHAPARSE